jgi:predicted ATPase/class 3 adenylate cyclase
MGAAGWPYHTESDMGVTLTTPSPIPAPLSRFIGRRRDLEQLRALVGPDRLVTIVGAGGCGKTRLAVELIRTLSGSYPDGIWLVELARIEDPSRVATTIAEAVHALKHPGTSRLEGSVQALFPGRQLLVLDNCEHVQGAVETAVRFLLANCPSLTVLATSRESLDMDGERIWRLQPLSLPEPDGSGQSESVELFQDRAGLAAQDAQLPSGQAAEIAAICRRLDGLPLALELAAAWVPVISLKQVVSRLDDGLSLLGHAQSGTPSRHGTMRAAVEWSYKLLDPSLQAAFERLSICAGGFTLAGAEAVLAGTAMDSSPLDLVASLVARSLVVADTAGDEARYRLLEPVRQFAAEKLQLRAGRSNDPRERYLRYLVGIAETAEELILGGPDIPSLRLLDSELANIRAILPWAFAHSRKHAARLTVALIWFVYIRSLYDEGIQWAETAMQMSVGRMRARAAHMVGVLSAQRSDIDAAERYLAEARELAASGGWLLDLTMVMFDQFVAAYHRGDVDAMRVRGQEAFHLARELRDDTRVMQTLFIPATLAHMEGDYRKASAVWREAIGHAERRHADWAAWMFRVSLGEVLVGSGDWLEADKVVAESLSSASDFRDSPITTAYLVENVGILAIERGERLEGLRLMAAARATFDRLRYRETTAEADRRRRWIDAARRELEPIRAEAAWQDGLTLTLPEATAQAQGMVGNDAGASTGLRPRSATKTFMFTDVVGSTALIGVIGDEAWQELIDWHNRMLRQKFVTHEGDEVDSAGDGFFVAFRDARAAAACAIDIQRMLAEHRRTHGFSPSVRIGLHEAMATRTGSAYRGRGVHLAARIAAQASGDEILVSSETAARLGAGYAVSRTRSIDLKGFSEPAVVAALDWR